MATAAWAAPPVLDLPLRCDFGRDCFIQNYFDHGVGAGYRDFTCGYLSYDGHAGTDFRVADLSAMRSGVEVVAAAAGVVAATRDGEPDIAIAKRGIEALHGKDAGNAVRITHGDGWETQYSHLRRGSVRVHKGQVVAAGEVLGLVGLSGRTAFPHVDFAVRRGGKNVDPFAVDSEACGSAAPQLWSADAARRAAYRPTGLLVAGFSVQPPTRELIESGEYRDRAIDADAAELSFFVELFGVRQGDVWRLELAGPDGQPLATKTNVIASNMAVWFVAVTKRRDGARWPAGSYAGVFRLERAGATITAERRPLDIR